MVIDFKNLNMGDYFDQMENICERPKTLINLSDTLTFNHHIIC